MHTRFGQELYPQETLRAAAIVADFCGEGELPADDRMVRRIADTLPHASAATRRRIAVKLVQRITAAAPCSAFMADAILGTAATNRAHVYAEEPSAVQSAQSNGHVPAHPTSTPTSADTLPGLRDNLEPFARLLAHLPDTQARRELVYYGAARADSLIAAIARDILYPYFIDGCIPTPYSEDEFIMANAGLLLAPEPILTAGFVADFARRAWNFDSERTVCLALRILRQAGILLAAPILGMRGRVAAYTLAPHGLSLAALLWGLHHEFGGMGIAPAWDQVGRAHFARLYVVSPAVIASRLWEAERAGLVGFWSVAGTKRVALKVRETDALSRLLLSNPCAK